MGGRRRSNWVRRELGSVACGRVSKQSAAEFTKSMRRSPPKKSAVDFNFEGLLDSVARWNQVRGGLY